MTIVCRMPRGNKRSFNVVEDDESASDAQTVVEVSEELVGEVQVV